MKQPGFLAAMRVEIQAELDARRAIHPHEVKLPGILRSTIGDDAFFAATQEHHRWIEKQGYGPYFVDVLCDVDGAEIGRSYRFADFYHASHFRLRF